MVFRSKYFYAVIVALLFIPASAFGRRSVLRFPDIHGERSSLRMAEIVWIASTSEAPQTRLTTHPGIEVSPNSRPTESGCLYRSYDGDEQVYVSRSGGEPKQLTFYPARADPLF